MGKRGKTQNFKILIAGEVLERLLGASGCYFSDSEIRKTHFFEKGPRTGKNLKFHFLVYALLCYLLCSTLLLDGLFR